MNEAHYVIFHPDFARQEVSVQAKAIVDGTVKSNWRGKIFVDAIGNGNEDPFVFNEKWLYSYCHASQLLRKPGSGTHLKAGSYLFFISGNAANKGYLAVDTVFAVGECHEWGKPLKLPLKFSQHHKSKTSDLWNRHFKFPFAGHHASVTHTYEAKMWLKGEIAFSFLPINDDGDKVAVPLNSLMLSLADKIRNKVKGKYPVLISDNEKNSLLKSILGQTKIQVVSGIKHLDPNQSGSKAAC